MKKVAGLSLLVVAFGCGDDGASGAPGFSSERRFAMPTYPQEPSTDTLCGLVVGVATTQSFVRLLGEPFQSYDFGTSSTHEYAFAQRGQQVPKLLVVNFDQDGVFDGSGAGAGMAFPACWTLAATDEADPSALPQSE